MNKKSAVAYVAFALMLFYAIPNLILLWEKGGIYFWLPIVGGVCCGFVWHWIERDADRHLNG